MGRLSGIFCLLVAMAFLATQAWGGNGTFYEVLFEFPLDEDPGWTTECDWAFGVPTGRGSVNGDPVSGHTGRFVYGYNLDGDYANNLSAASLITQFLDCSGYQDVRLGFWRWLGVSNGSFDSASVQVSADGQTWTRVWSHSTTLISESAWTYVEYDISSVADGRGAVQIQWVMGPTSSSTTRAGWNIDDIVIKGVRNDPLRVAPADGLLVQVRPEETFRRQSVTYILTNESDQPLGWVSSLQGNPGPAPWLEVSPVSGVLPAGGSAPVVMSLREEVRSLDPGRHSALVFLRNVSTGVDRARRADVEGVVAPAGALYFFPFEGDPGWGVTGNWRFGEPSGEGTSGGDPRSGHTSRYVYGYNLKGDYDSFLPSRYLTTQALNCSAYGNVRLSYWRWLGVEEGRFDGASIEVSADGASWTTAWRNPSDSNTTDSLWVYQDVDISTVADGEERVFVRWVMGPTDMLLNYPGWNVDDVALIGEVVNPLVVE
ncbi:hypothetical protein HQ520_16510, partial [bacterium]|nr:hypothetical protein [bacterium]